MQHGVDYTEEIPPLTLTGSKAAATLAVSEQWLQQLEQLYQAEASTSSEAKTASGSGCRLASGDAMLKWLTDWEPDLPCTQTLPGKTPAEVSCNQSLVLVLVFRLPEPNSACHIRQTLENFALALVLSSG